MRELCITCGHVCTCLGQAAGAAGFAPLRTGHLGPCPYRDRACLWGGSSGPALSGERLQVDFPQISVRIPHEGAKYASSAFNRQGRKPQLQRCCRRRWLCLQRHGSESWCLSHRHLLLLEEQKRRSERKLLTLIFSRRLFNRLGSHEHGNKCPVRESSRALFERLNI